MKARAGMSCARFGKHAAALFVLAVVLSQRPALADDDDAAAAPAPALTPALTYDGTALANLHGGLRRGSTYLGNLHLKLSAAGDAVGWPGTSAFVDVLTIHGGQPSRWVGDAQGVSNLAGPGGTQVEELWLQYNSRRGNASILLGIYDLNSEFYRLRAAGLFLNSAFGIGPEFAQSGIAGPSIFPRTSFGLRIAVKPTADTVLRAAVLDGVPVVRPDGSHGILRRGDGLLGVVEFASLSRGGASLDRRASMRNRIGRLSSLPPYDDKTALGVWHYSTRLADVGASDATSSAATHRGSSGAYAIAERLLVGDSAQAERLAAFAQAGVADPRTNRFGSYLGAGLVGSGWHKAKDSDQFGFSMARAINGTDYRRARAKQGVTRAETTIELSYLTEVSKDVTLQPDLQRVIHPNTDPSLASAWVLQLRFEVAF